MSGLSGIANWALGGLRGSNDDANTNDDNSAQQPAAEQLSPDDIRRRRLARMSAAATNPAPVLESGIQDVVMESSSDNLEVHNNGSVEDSSSIIGKIENEEGVMAKTVEATAMEVDASESVEENPSGSKKKRMVDVLENDVKDKVESQGLGSPRKNKSSLATNKNLLLKQLLLISVNYSSNDSSLVNIDVDATLSSGDDGLSLQSIGEILALRLAIPSKSPELKSQRYNSTVSYLVGCFKRSSEQRNQMLSSSAKDSLQQTQLIEFVQEIETQLISYTASSLAYPDLFPSMENGSFQLSQMFQSDSLSLTIGGPSNSFYGRVCAELDEQGMLKDVVLSITKDLMASLKKCNTALDNGAATIGALADLASNKKAATVMVQLDNFLLPPENSPQASERVEGEVTEMTGLNPHQQQMFRMMQMMSGRSYLKRSGPALEKDTLLGLCMRLGIPSQDPSITTQFSNPARRTRANVEGTKSTLRRQLQIHRDATLRLIKSLLMSGPQSRQRVMAWFSECLLLNYTATAISPNPLVVSSKQTLLNVSYILLKLSEPFLNNDEKLPFIDPSFIRSSDAHSGVFATSGDGSVTRLSSNLDESQQEKYSPKNSFIPICFFYTARSLNIGFLPTVQRYENVFRRLQHEGWMLSQRGGNWRDDENYNRLLELQFSHEVTACDGALLEITLAFYECMAKFLNSLGECNV